jgi:hypothetical protein
MEGTRRSKESTRKIFERGVRSEQRSTRVHSEGRVQEEQAESESRKETAKFEGKMDEIKRRKIERSTTRGTGMPMKKWKD